MRTVAARLRPGDDLLDGAMTLARDHELRAPFMLTTVGSLSRAVLRMAGAATAATLDGTFEIVSLVGTLAEDGAHLHLAISDETGAMTGGHLLAGSIVRTTVEIVLGEADDVVFRRSIDPETTWDELVVEPRRD